MNFATVGTNWITEAFIQAGSSLKDFQLQAVYSRNIERARTLADQYDAPSAYDDLEQLCRDTNVEALYIASPTRHHFSIAMTGIQHGKHIICEKPMCSNAEEAKRLLAAASEYGVTIMEAIKNMYFPAWETVSNHLDEIGRLRRASISYCQYSSRYDAYREGTVLNAFKPELSNGASMDIGIYCLHPALELLGMPHTVQAHGYLLETGADGQAAVLLGYPEAQAVVSYSKISSSTQPVELQGEDGTITIDHINHMHRVTLTKKEETTVLWENNQEDSMAHEIRAFIQLCAGEDVRHIPIERSIQVLQVLDEIRAQIGVHFPADTEE